MPPTVARVADGLLALTAIGVPLSTTAMQAGVIGLAVLAAIGAGARWPVARRTPLDGVLGLFYATLALSTVASGHPLEATGWARLWIVVAYFAVAWWLRDRAHAVTVARVLVVAGVVAAAYGILQHFTGADWYRALLGRPLKVKPRAPGSEGFAVVGFFRNYLTFAHVMLFPFAWSAAWAARGHVAGALGAGLILIAIVLSTARGAWVGAAAVVLALALLVRAWRGLGVLAGVALLATLAIAGQSDLRREARRMFELGGRNVARVAIYQANLAIVHDHPVFGLGFGRYRQAARPYYEAHPAADRRSHAHSNYLQIAAEAGLVGLAAFVLVFAAALRLGWQAVCRAPDTPAWAAAAGAWCGLVGFLVGGLTQYSFGDNEVALAMWLALAILMRCRQG